MIRDFWEIRKRTLYDEIQGLKDKVSGSSWRAIDAVREIGNIGAHMEKDVDVIIDVEPEEAGLLLRLIETLTEDWYIARYEREARNQALIEAAKDKERQKSEGGAGSGTEVNPTERP